MIEAIYKEPKFTIKDGKTQTNTRRQMAGIRQGCPLSLYLFTLLLTTITYDVRKVLIYKRKLISQQDNCTAQTSVNYTTPTTH